MFQPLTSMTKAIAVALDIAGRPDTDDAYALNSVRKAYRLLNGGTFQDLVTQHERAAPTIDFGFDWSEAYRLEASKNQALTRQVAELKAELEGKGHSGSNKAQPWREPVHRRELDGHRSPRIDSTRENILTYLADADRTAPEISRATGIHLRTVQRRLRELIAIGSVSHTVVGISPVYSTRASD